ncbi:YhcN/YlaJ family sporulation lipoprotein [Halobacillus locisalis]|uniref:YhcN/YlaJ family sporulation lipoprotein n=1 Tax=Halobacillus locisalis TaxID=220753 RepID=A0A838CQT4_9BACI|nr:YhcN/YlaJ family sporulation lipoprotein [Halobacillus locisalis]MBA2174311.1 YhcN/YlaJ family sporulation lipoprotein [Halobacillus locisalis]
MKKLIIVACFIFLAACQQNNEESLLRERQSDSDLKYVTDSDPVEKENLTTQQVARRLAKTAVEVPDVHDATAIVLGNYVAVGIDVDKDLDRSRVGVIKYSVAEALKHDPYGKQALVIADADGVERLRGVGQKISEGHPIEAMTDELSQIVARYMPEGPINERPQTNTNQESIPSEDHKQLDQIEKEQSKER